MAVVRRKTDVRDYGSAERELQGRILDIYGEKSNELDLFRPTLADHQKVGFFSLDRPSQTEVTEIVDLKEMTEVLQAVLLDVSELKRDIHLSKQIMQADYEVKLKDKSIELYNRVNERVAELEKMHDDKVDVVRRAYKQQLSDVITKITAVYAKNMESQIETLQRQKLGDASGILEKYRELQLKLQRNESVIHMLRMQLAQYTSKPPVIEESREEIDSEPSKSPTSSGVNEDMSDELRLEIRNLEGKITSLEEELDVKDEESSQLTMEIQDLNDILEKEKMMVQQLHHETEQTKMSSDKDKATSKKQQHQSNSSSPQHMMSHVQSHDFSTSSHGSHDNQDLDRQKLELEKDMDNKLKHLKQELIANAEGNLKNVQEAEKNKLKLIAEQNRQLTEQLVQEKAKSGKKSKEELDLEKIKETDLKLKAEVIRLKKEIDRVHRAWEMKFTILQASLHALKDESYLRQNLQRQAATLHQAAISYASDVPLGIRPTKQHSPRKIPLPDIPKSAGKGSLPDKDYYSYTVSAQSGRGTTVFSVDENQIMSDSEVQDLPSDIPLLPEPPKRKPTECGDEGSRPSTSPVIKVPSAVEVQ